MNTDLFTQAQQVGDGGTALQNAVLGRKLGFDNYMSQLVSGVATSATNLVAGSGIVATAAAYGATTITISGLTAAIPAGSWCTIDSRPYRVVSSTGGSTPTAITITSPGLLASAAVNAVVQCYSSGTIAADYGSHTNYLAAGYAGPITITGLTNLPTPGQLVTFGHGIGIGVEVTMNGQKTTSPYLQHDYNRSQDQKVIWTEQILQLWGVSL